MSVEQRGRELKEAEYFVRNVPKGRSDVGRTLSRAVGSYNEAIKKRNKRRFEGELKDMTKYYEKKARANSDYMGDLGRR